MPLFSVMVGCGGTQGERISVPTTPLEEQVKSILKSCAETGQPIGSGSMIFSEYLVKLEASDAAKAKALQPEFDAFSGASNPADVKAKAAALLKKL